VSPGAPSTGAQGAAGGRAEARGQNPHLTGTAPLWLYLVLGIGTLVRPDAAITFGAVWLFLIVASPTRARRRHLLAGFLIFGLSGLGQTAFRLWYFHDIFPNTYYLKMTGYPILLRVSRGAVVLVQFIWAMNPLLFLLPLVLLSRTSPAMLLLLCLLVVQMAYSVYVGGDAWSTGEAAIAMCRS
jgi:hypothetical protein